MARQAYGRLRLRGALTTLGPLHVGGHGDDVDADLPLARNGAGEFYVPGTSLAGALRQWSESAFGPALVHSVWGFQDGDKGHASWIVVEDAALDGPASSRILAEVRDGVGIDRDRGGAAEHIKYDRAMLPRRAKLQFELTLDVPAAAERTSRLALIGGLKRALEAGEVRLGAAKTRGAGKVRLDGAVLSEEVFGTRAGVLAMLAGQASGVSDIAIEAALAEHPPVPAPRLVIRIDWRPLGPIMVKSGLEGVAIDMLPFMAEADGGFTPVLPGSSLKGALRSQAERIMRTLLGTKAKRKFLDDLQVPLVIDLFGSRGGADHRKGDGPLPGLGALGVEDCWGNLRLSADQWRSIASARDDKALTVALALAGLRWQGAYHVAVDRWTGGAAESFLYTILEPHATAWGPMELSVDLSRLRDEARLPAIALLLLTLRDLASGEIAPGYGANRGMGTIKVESATAMVRDASGPLAALNGVNLAAGLPGEVRASLNSAWGAWLKAARAGSGK